MFKLVLEKAEEPELKLPTSTGSLKKQESSRKNIYFCFIDYAKAFDCVDHNKLWKFWKRWEYHSYLYIYNISYLKLKGTTGMVEFQVQVGLCNWTA